jgi:putative sigma-54 modulation protein
MRIDIRGHRIELTDALRAHIERRLCFALGRFGTRITAVKVTIEDLNGPRGGVDKQCRMTAALASAGHLWVEVLDTAITPAVDQAADRLGRAVTREFERHSSYATYRPFLTRTTANTLFQRQARSIKQERAV